MTSADIVFKVTIFSNDGGKYAAEITDKGRFVKRKSGFSSAQKAKEWADRWAAENGIQKKLEASFIKFK